MLRKYSFLAVGRKHSETSEIKKIEIFDLDIILDPIHLKIEEQVKLQLGFAEFLKESCVTTEVLTKLDQLDRNDEAIKPTSLRKIRKKYAIGVFDRLEPVKVQFKSQYRYNACEKFFPTFMTTSLATQFLLLIPLLIATNGKSDIDIFSLDPIAAQGLGTTQGLLFTLYNLVNVFIGPGINNIGQIGACFDSFFHTCWRFLNREKKISPAIIELDTCSNRAKRRVAKLGMTLITLGYLISDFIANYQQLGSIDQSIDEMMASSIFPRTILYYGMNFYLYLNQLNNPVYGWSLLKYVNQQVDLKYAKNVFRIPASRHDEQKLIKISTSEAESRVLSPHDELMAIKHIDLSIRLLNENHLKFNAKKSSNCWRRFCDFFSCRQRKNMAVRFEKLQPLI